MRIGIYGKGGIGKSTICANLAAAFVHQGVQVLQVGCDPKHDSTRLLLGGQKITTVLNYLRCTPPEARKSQDIILKGYKNIACVEAGGPEPGVGCAGRGILSAFSLLERLGVSFQEYDVTIFDVLGDVVCGGFAVPLRRGFARTILVVTSEEFMSIYAANNILRGVRNMGQGKPRAMGIILNRRERNGDVSHVTRFAEAVGVPLLIEVPRSSLFAEAEYSARTLLEAYPKSSEAQLFSLLAESLPQVPHCIPSPLTDEMLHQVVIPKKTISTQHPVQHSPENHIQPEEESFGTSLPETSEITPQESTGHRKVLSARFLSKSLLTREPLHGCAFAGAINTLTQIRGAVTLVHGPQSCIHIATSTMLSSGLGTMARYGNIIPEQIDPAIVSTNLNEAALIHGGLDAFAQTLAHVQSRHEGPVFIVTTCPAGVIGDDVQTIIDASTRSGGPPILPINTDGNIEGDYLQGVINACIQGAASLISTSCRTEEDCVNIVAEKNIALNADVNFAIVEHLLHMLGLRVNCRFVRRTTAEALSGYLKAPLNLLAYNDHLGRVLKDFLGERFACRFARYPFPSGFHETERWLRQIASFFHCQTQADAALDELYHEYRQGITEIGDQLRGIRLMLVTYNHDVDWILETAFDVGMEIVKVGIVNYSQDGLYRTQYPDRIQTEIGYNPNQRADDITRLQPDLVLSNYQSPGLPLTTHYDTIPLCPDVGHLGGLMLARRWARLLQTPLREGWRADEERLLGSGQHTREGLR
jgi:nitrogenase iron protein NifH